MSVPQPQQPQPGAPLGAPPPQPASSRKPALIAGLVIAVVVLGVAAYLLMGRKEPAPLAPPAPETVRGPSTSEASITSAQRLPPLTQSDPRVRELVGLLSPEPELQKWLAGTEDLARRFTTAVNNISEGESPRASLSFLAPPGAFQTVERKGHTFIAPGSFARYDAVTRVLTSLDTQASVLTYRALKSLFEQAYAEIGRPGQTFDQTFTKALQKMLDTPVPEGELEVVPAKGALFAYAAPELEQLSPAQKHLLRMGPEHARALQAKLREFQAALAQPDLGHH
jgi:hypothetical protein